MMSICKNQRKKYHVKSKYELILSHEINDIVHLDY